MSKKDTNASKKVTSDAWFIRITAPWDHISSKTTHIREQIDFVGMMIGYHHGDKGGAPHAHICLKLKGQLQKQSVDARYKKLFDVSGPQYSSKVWDGDVKAMSYLYHDESGKVENYMGLSDDDIAKIKDLNVEIQKVVKKNKERASNRVVDYVVKQCQEQGLEPDAMDIGRMILQAVVAGEFYHPGAFMLERYISEIELKLASSDKHRLAQAIDAQLLRLSMFRR